MAVNFYQVLICYKYRIYLKSKKIASIYLIRSMKGNVLRIALFY